MNDYEAAVTMFHREHARWNQWALFFFGSVVSIFIIAEKVKDHVPGWVPPLLACVASLMWIAVATNIRASTYAWRETVRELETGSNNQKGVIQIQKEKYDQFHHWEDLQTTLNFWSKETITSVTRILTLFGVISAFGFFVLFIVLFIKELVA